MKSRTTKFIHNSGAALLLQICTTIAGIITPYILLRAYGSEINGLVSSVTQFLAYFILIEAGLSSSAIYALYKPLAENDTEKRNGILSATKRSYDRIALIFFGMVLIFSVVYSFYIQASSLSPVYVGILVLIIGAKSLFEFLTLSKYRVLLTADQKSFVISYASIISVVVNTILIVILANNNVNIVLLKALTVMTVFLRSLVLWFYCKSHYNDLNYHATPDMSALDKRKAALYLQVLGAIQSGAPIVILTLFLKDLKAVSVYAVFNMVIGGINSILSVFITGLPASFGEIIAKNEKAVLKKAYNVFELVYYLLITFVYTVAFSTIMSFVGLYTKQVTDVNYYQPLLGVLFVLNGFLYNVKTPQGMLIISAGLFRETKIQTTIQGAILVVAGIALTPSLGIAGVLIASILSNLYRVVDLLIYVPKNITALPIKNSAIRIILLMICSTAVSLLFIYVDYNTENYWQWVIYACFVSVITIVVLGLYMLLFERQNMKEVLARLKSMVMKK